jgi:shikimate 5-dehydrogenase
MSMHNKYGVKSIKAVNRFRKKFRELQEQHQEDLDALMRKHAKNADDVINGREMGKFVEPDIEDKAGWVADVKELMDGEVEVNELDLLDFSHILKPIELTPAEFEAIEPFVKGVPN